MTKFNKGDLVFSIKDGWCTVEVVDDTVLPIKAGVNWYTAEGYWDATDRVLIPFLYTKEEALRKFPEFPLPYLTSSTVFSKELEFHGNNILT